MAEIENNDEEDNDPREDVLGQFVSHKQIEVVAAALSLGIVVVVRDVDPRQVVGDDATDAAHVPRHLREHGLRSLLCVFGLRVIWGS